VVYKLRKINGHTHVFALFNKSIRKFIKKGYDPIIHQHIAWLPFLQGQSRFPFFIHADWKALVLYEDRPLKSRNGRGRRIIIHKYLATVTPIAAESRSALATGGFSLFHLNMPLLYILFTSTFAVAVVANLSAR